MGILQKIGGGKAGKVTEKTYQSAKRWCVRIRPFTWEPPAKEKLTLGKKDGFTTCRCALLEKMSQKLRGMQRGSGKETDGRKQVDGSGSEP